MLAERRRVRECADHLHRTAVFSQRGVRFDLLLAQALSQKCRKKIEEIFGWAKTTGCFRKSRYHGVERTHAQGQYVVATCNLVRMARLMMTAPPKPAGA